MVVNSVAENILGTTGTVLWSAQLVPQIWKSWREHSTTGLSSLLVLIWGSAALPLGAYNILQSLNIPLVVQPQLFGALSFISWGQCLYYEKRKSRLQACAIAVSAMLITGSLEAAMVFAIRPSMNKRAIDFFGVFASIVIAAGLLPQYWEILKRWEVIGISITFIVIDTLGGVFSLLSLVFRPQFDVFAAVAYSIVIVMDGFIVVAAIILNPLARRRRRRLDASREAVPSQGPRQMTQSSAGTSIWKPTPVVQLSSL